MKRPRAQRRGFSLVELLVASTITVLAIAMASLGFLAQNKALQALDLTRVANVAARDAMIPIESSLRDLGWGIDPRFAIDLTYNCASSPCRDHNDAPDELAFVARDANYRWADLGETTCAAANTACPGGACATAGGCFVGHAWHPTSPGGGVLAIDTATRQLHFPTTAPITFHNNRLVMLTCQGGVSPVILTLSSQTAVASASLATPTNVTLNYAATNSFPYNYSAGILPCHSNLGSGLYLVDRYRYFIWTPFTGSAPWLMLDTGLDLDNDGNPSTTDSDDWIPISKNVEDMQVAYVLNTGTGTGPSNSDWIVGNGPVTAAEDLIAPDGGTNEPLYTTLTTDTRRFNKQSANARAVRVTLSLRSDRTDQTQPTAWTGDPFQPAENRTTPYPAGGRYRRYTVTSEITLRNMDARSPFTF